MITRNLTRLMVSVVNQHTVSILFFNFTTISIYSLIFYYYSYCDDDIYICYVPFDEDVFVDKGGITMLFCAESTRSESHD